jgi:hypothetical protein
MGNKPNQYMKEYKILKDLALKKVDTKKMVFIILF